MSSKFGGSKFRHIVGTVQKKELWYPDLKPSTTASGDSNLVAASAYWVAVSGSSAGSVNLLQLDQPGKRKTVELPTVNAHGVEIADMAFSPYKDDILATSSDDATVKLWSVPPTTTGSISNATVTLSGHKKRVDAIRFHPAANNVIASGSSDKTVKVWDLESGKEKFSFDHGDGVTGLDWSWDGSLLATVSKDKKIRIIDPRANQITATGDGHQGVKASRVVWLGDSHKIATSGFSKMRERQFGIWDSRDLSKSLSMSTIDSSTGVVDLFYDADSSILVVAGKGDSNVKLVEINEGTPAYTELTNVSGETQKSTTVIPKRAVDLMNTEIIRLLKVTNNAVVPVSFAVPRKAKTEFQEDLYPPTKAAEPVLTAEAWFSGETKSPAKIQLKPSHNPHKFWEHANEPTETKATVPSLQNLSLSSEPAPSVTANSESPRESPRAQTESPKASTSTYVPKSVKVVRSSKYRHIAGKGTKMDDCYTNLKVSSASNNSVIKANPTFFCVPWQSAANAGLVAVIPLAKPGRRPDILPLLECGSPCLDFDWNPFDDYMLSTVTENAYVQIWKIPKEGITKTTTTPDMVLKGHMRRVTTVDFHPNVANIVVTTSNDNTTRLWDLEKGSEALKLEGPNDMVNSVTWNWNGSVMATASKDKEMRLYDPRANSLISKTIAHDGAKGFKATWLGRNERIATVGHSRSSERQMSIWDSRKIDSPLHTISIDQGSGMITPFYDPDTSVLYLSGKGDGNIKMYEIEEEAPYMHFLTEHQSNVSAQGLAILPKTRCNVKECEISRFVKLANDYAEPLSFKVPRTRMEYFQDDLFPPTKKVAPSMASGEWLGGANKEPELLNLQPTGMKKLSEAPVEQKEKKYTFDPNRPEEFTRDKMMDKYYQQVESLKEEEKTVLKQDLMEGVDASEWDD